jgi:hypothetical protein
VTHLASWLRWRSQQFWPGCADRRWAARRSSHPVFVFAKTKNIEHNLNPAGNAELIENPKQVILDGMLGKSQAPCDLPIGQAFRHTANYMLFPLGKDRFTRRFDRSHRFRFTQSLDRISELRTICLDLALMNAMNALGETFRGFRTRENSMGATAEC